jgi:hypothetical protein
MPERKNLYRWRFGDHTIVEIVMDSGKVNATDTDELNIPSPRSNRWLGSKKLQCALKLH